MTETEKEREDLEIDDFENVCNQCLEGRQE